MANINELNLRDETFQLDFDSIPTGLGSFITPPQPGIYQFRLPPEIILNRCFEVREDPKAGQILSAVLRDDAALWNVTLNEPYNARISNNIRLLPQRSSPDEPLAISDLAMLLKAVNSPPAAATNAAYAEALVAAAERTFHAKSTLTARCDASRDIYSGGSEKKGVKGCGTRFSTEPYTSKKGETVWQIPVENGIYQLRFLCGKCQRAELRAWGQLQGFRP